MIEIITGRELSNRLQPKMQYLHKHCGIIFAVDNVNTAFSRATITFTKIGGIDGILTAHHVYDKLKNSETRIFCNLEEQAIQLPEARYYSKELDYVWLPLTLFDELKYDSILFFDTKHAHQISDTFYRDCNVMTPDAAAREPSNLLINGSPNFALSYDKSRRLQKLSLQPMLLSLRQFKHARSVVESKPQIILEFDAEQLGINDEQLKSKFEQNMQSDICGSAFGGYSGGPLCVFVSDGFFLVGITSECKKIGNLYVVIATPITAIIDDMQQNSLGKG